MPARVVVGGGVLVIVRVWVTVPVGGGVPPDPVTVAVKVTEDPYVEGVPEVVSVVVVVGPLATVSTPAVP